MLGRDVVRYLEGQGFTGLHVGFQPASPDDCITITEGSAPVPAESDGLSLDSVGIQVRVRAKKHDDANDRAWAIHRLLAGFGGQAFDAGGAEVYMTNVQTAPSYLGPDEEKKRHVYSAYYLVFFVSEPSAHRG
jgi:hypothetical protein